MSINKLPTGLKELLVKLNKEYNLDKLIKKPHLNEYIKVHSQINKTLIDNNISSKEFNDAINFYKKKNDSTLILKKFKLITKKKNNFLLESAYRSKEWINCLKKLKKKYNIINYNISSHDIEDGLISILYNYKTDWNGFWSTFEYNKEKPIELKKIKVIDIDDINRFNKFLIHKGYYIK